MVFQPGTLSHFLGLAWKFMPTSYRWHNSCVCFTICYKKFKIVAVM
ncbi:hypothetical protein LEMLEM_LOCUS14709 [Lemmus lemmus]